MHDDRRTALEGDEEAYTPRAVGDDAEGVIDGRGAEPAKMTPGARHTRRTLVRRALIVSDAWPLGRSIARVYIRTRVAFLQKTVIIGAGLVGQEIARKIRRNPSYGLELAGFVDADPLPMHHELSDVRVLGSTEQLVEIVREHGI